MLTVATWYGTERPMNTNGHVISFKSALDTFWSDNCDKDKDKYERVSFQALVEPIEPSRIIYDLIIGNNNNNMGMNRLVWHFCAGRVPERGGGRSDDWVRGQPAPPGPVFAEAHGDAFTSGWGESLPAGHRSDPRRSVSSLRGLPQLQPIVFPISFNVLHHFPALNLKVSLSQSGWTKFNPLWQSNQKVEVYTFYIQDVYNHFKMIT